MKLALMVFGYLVIGLVAGVTHIALAKKSNQSKNNAATGAILALLFWPVYIPVTLVAMTLDFVHDFFIKVADRLWTNE